MNETRTCSSGSANASPSRTTCSSASRAAAPEAPEQAHRGGCRRDLGLRGGGLGRDQRWVFRRSETSASRRGRHRTGGERTGGDWTDRGSRYRIGSDDFSYRIPPEGTAVSTPVEGKLIAEAFVGEFGQVRVYADGRVLSDWKGRPAGCRDSASSNDGSRWRASSSWRSGALGPTDGWIPLGHPVSTDYRQSAWEDREGKPWVPARYGACFWHVDVLQTLRLS